MKNVSIDTCIYSAFKQNMPGVAEALRKFDFIGVDISVIAELLSGFLLGKKEKQNRAELEEFLNSPRVEILPHDLATAEHFAAIVRNLKKKGRPIPVNDIWIAASAMRHGLALYTFDRHFEAVDGLILEEQG